MTRICQQIRALLTQHIQIAGDVITQIKTGNIAQRQTYTQQWYHNATQFGQLMGTINSYTPTDQAVAWMHEHVRLTDAIAIHNHSLVASEQMADFFAQGLVRQFRL